MARQPLPPLVRALLGPSAYPHPVDRVELIQTHISYVFLAGDLVYKVKKPVNFGFLDFSTPPKRRYYCRQEVVLNSRLCPDIYLGVSRIVERDGRFGIDTPGRIVEYAVRMRRLPAERMMDRLLAEGKLTAPMVERVAERLVPFHQTAETSPRIARYGDWAIRYNWDENIAQWAPYIGRTVSLEQDRILRAYGRAFFARKAKILQGRVDELRIRRVHADLRSDAVCLTNGVCIFDCVEFSRRLSLLDVARDVGFLAMDLDYRGRSDLAQAFVRRYLDLSSDTDMPQILDFYKAYSACVRGKVESFLLDEPEIVAAQKRRAQKAARRYFELACRYAASLPPSFLIIVCGLTATGKSTLARNLAGVTGAKLHSSDVVRKELVGLVSEEHQFERFERGIYSREFTERTYAALLEGARLALEQGHSVVLDASFARRKHRQMAARLAEEKGAPFVCAECRAPETTVRRRLAHRLRTARDPSDARWEVYVAQRRRFQPVNEVSPERHIIVGARGSLESRGRKVLRTLRLLSPMSAQAS